MTTKRSNDTVETQRAAAASAEEAAARCRANGWETKARFYDKVARAHTTVADHLAAGGTLETLGRGK